MNRKLLSVGSATAVVAIVVALAVGAGCSATRSGTAPGSGAATPAPTSVVRLGFFPNITHSQALVGVAQGRFQKAFGDRATLQPQAFNAGPEAIEALFAKQIDISYIGPNPSINGYVKSQGKALKVIAGATSGGAVLVLRRDVAVTKPADLAGKKLATPQLGNTQDVALRAYLKANDLATTDKGGNVEIIPTANPDSLTLLQKKEIHGAWVPEPWGARLEKEANGRVFLDERDLWPGGRFVTANVIVRTEFLEKNPELVKAFLAEHVDLTLWINDNPAEARKIANEQIKALTGKALPSDVLDPAWERLEITYDPVSSSLLKSADAAFELGFLGKEKPDLSGIYELAPLNGVLKEKGLAEVK